MIQEAGLHLNEGQTHDELGKNNPSNSYSPLFSLYATRDVLQKRCLPNQQKFNTDDIRSLWNLVRSTDLWM